MHGKYDPNQPIIWHKLNNLYLLLIHIIEGIMSESNLINNNKHDNRVLVKTVAKYDEGTLLLNPTKFNKLSKHNS